MDSHGAITKKLNEEHTKVKKGAKFTTTSIKCIQNQNTFQ